MSICSIIQYDIGRLASTSIQPDLRFYIAFQTQQEETFTPSYLIVSLSLLWWACLTLCFLYLVLSVLGLPFARSLVTRFRLHGQHHSLRGSFAATGLMLQLGSTMGGAYARGRLVVCFHLRSNKNCVMG